MRIIVKDSDMRFPIKLHLPTSILLSRFALRFLPPSMKSITREQAKKLIRELKRCKKRYPGWKLVEVHSADGEYVEIRL